MKKKCCCCGEEKELEAFCKNKRSTDGLHYYCKECSNRRTREWRWNNPDKVKDYNKQHSADRMRWERENIELVREQRRQRYRKNKTKINRRVAACFHRRYNEDALFSYKAKCRMTIYRAVHAAQYKDWTKMAFLLGCSHAALWRHLSKTWKDRYETAYAGEPFEIDHITPLSSATDEKQVRTLCHYTNLQMLTPEDNRKKGTGNNSVLDNDKV